MFRPVGPEVEIARSADWSITVSRSQDGGFCISHSGTDGGSGIAAGGLPSPGDDSKRLVMDIGSPAMRKGHVGFVAGLVMPDVARVQVRFRDGTSISAETEAAPDALDADLRTFVIETPADEKPSGRGFRRGCGNTFCSRRTVRFWSDERIRVSRASPEAAQASFANARQVTAFAPHVETDQIGEESRRRQSGTLPRQGTACDARMNW